MIRFKRKRRAFQKHGCSSRNLTAGLYQASIKHLRISRSCTYDMMVVMGAYFQTAGEEFLNNAKDCFYVSARPNPGVQKRPGIRWLSTGLHYVRCDVTGVAIQLGKIQTSDLRVMMVQLMQVHIFMTSYLTGAERQAQFCSIQVFKRDPGFDGFPRDCTKCAVM